MVEVEESRELMTCEIESGTFTSVCDLLRHGSVLFFGNMASEWRKCTKRELSGYEQGIIPANKKQHILSLPATAPAPLMD